MWGPYEKDPKNPIVTSVPGESYERQDPDHLKPKYYNPDSLLQKSGHGSYVELPTGEVYLVHLCARPFVPELRCTLGRETAIQKMMWTEDGWLRMADGSNLAKMEAPESSLPEVTMPQIPDFDDFDGEELGNYYYAPRIMPQRFADVKSRSGYVRIRGQESRTSLNKVSILTRKLTSVYARITTKMEFTPEVHQHSAGLILYYDNMNYINLRKYYSETLGQSAISIIHLEKFVLLFLKDSSFQTFRQAMDQGDTEEAFRAVHTLKGVCMNLSFDSLYRISSEITEYLRAGQTDRAMEALPELESCYEKHVRVIGAYSGN
uniref:beta-xylosidase family glycoside hydrolase n=1 Tax=Candidatus Ventrimonas sp. TaxID=3048889 RepID=UPI003FEF71BD